MWDVGAEREWGSEDCYRGTGIWVKEGLLKIGWDLEEGRLIRKGLELEGRKVY